jgi:hypothetical protein
MHPNLIVREIAAEAAETSVAIQPRSRKARFLAYT